MKYSRIRWQHGGYDRHLRKLRSTLRVQRDAMNLALKRHMPKGVQWTLPAGGYFIWLQLPVETDALMLHREAIGQGVSLAPGPILSATRGFRHCVRLNFGHPWSDDIDRAVRALGELIAKATTQRAA